MEATTTDVCLNRSPSAYNLLIFTHSQEKADEKDCVSYSIHEVGEGAAKVIKRLAQEEQRVKKKDHISLYYLNMFSLFLFTLYRRVFTLSLAFQDSSQKNGTSQTAGVCV